MIFIKKAVLVIIGICFVLFLSLLVYAGGCGVGCSSTSRSVSTGDVSVSITPDDVRNLDGPQDQDIVALCGRANGAGFSPCAYEESITACTGSSSTCDSFTAELTAFRFNRSNSVFSRQDSESYGDYVVTLGSYDDSSDGKTGILAVVTDKSGNLICQKGLKNNESEDYFEARVASIRPGADTFYIGIRANTSTDNTIQGLHVVELNLTTCSVINSSGIRIENLPVYYYLAELNDAADDSTPVSEGQNMDFVGSIRGNRSIAQDTVFFATVIGVNSTWGISATTTKQGGGQQNNTLFSVDYSITNGTFVSVGRRNYFNAGPDIDGIILHTIPGSFTAGLTKMPVYKEYRVGGTESFVFKDVNCLDYSEICYFGAVMVNQYNGTNNPNFGEYNTTAASANNGVQYLRKMPLNGTRDVSAPVNFSNEIWLAFYNSSGQNAVIYQLNNTWGVVNNFSLSNTIPKDIVAGSNGVFVAGDDTSGTNAVFAGLTNTGFLTQILISNLTPGGQNVLTDPADIFFLGGVNTNNDLVIEALNASEAEVFSATNPNGTTRFTTDKSVQIATYEPDINILNFQLDWQVFNGSFDTTLGLCYNCSYDGANDPSAGGTGYCQAEVEKIWGMFNNYNLTITLTVDTPNAAAINFSRLALECKPYATAISQNSNCTRLSPYTDTTSACFTPSVPAAYSSYASVAGSTVSINLTSFYPNLTSMPFGTISPSATCEQIACEVTGEWVPGNTQEFTVNKTITVTAI